MRHSFVFEDGFSLSLLSLQIRSFSLPFRCFDESQDRLENDLILSNMALDALFELRQGELFHAMSFSPSKISE